MKKKLSIILAVLLVVLLAACSGDNKPVADNPPAGSSTPEVTQTASPEPDNEKSPAPDAGSETVEYLQGDELIALFQKVYDDVAKQDYPQEYRLQTEVLFLSEYNDTGKELPLDYEEQYLDWRPEDKAAEPESDVSAETQQPSNTQPSNPPAQQPSSPQPTPNPGNSGNLADADGNGIPDIMQGEGAEEGVSSDHTDLETGGSSDTDHDYSGITIGTGSDSGNTGNSGSNNQGISGGNSNVDANGDGWPDDMQMEETGTGTSDHYNEDMEVEADTDHDYSGITIK